MREPVSISIKPDSAIRLNITQFIVVVVACLSSAFACGVFYVEMKNHPSQEAFTRLERRVTELETELRILKGK